MCDLETYVVSEEEIQKNLIFDLKNRPICLVRINGQQLRFYVGPDAHGFIFESEDGDYIKVGNEYRWWRGILDPIPNDSRLNRLNEFGFCSIKPDAFERGLDSLIKEEIKSMGMEIVDEKSVLIKKSELFHLYPYFFESEWESVLIKYFCSAPTLFMVIRSQAATNQLLDLRRMIRSNFRKPEEHPIRNLFHCSDSKMEAVREAIIFFGVEGLVELVGCSKEDK